jgi:hypothetical protein
MSLAQHFSADYSEARRRFREAAAASGARLEFLPYPVKGPAGEELTTDVARIGPDDASSVLVSMSGTHGVEGFCGSGIQLAALASGLHREVPKGGAIIFIHAINPYGFAWVRRVTHENVDLNRNFVDFAKKLPENPGYEALWDAICPREWTDEALEAAQARMNAYAEEHGTAALQKAVSGGQYRHDDGIFYGGTAPTASRLNLERIVDTHLKRARRVAVIDWHTGLGPYGYGEPIVVHAPGSAALQRALDWYGDTVGSPALGTSASPELSGVNVEGIERRLAPGTELTAMALEFGTLPQRQVRDAIRADNWLHRWGDLASAKGRALKQAMREAFYCDADDWKSMVAEQGVERQRQALKGLAM